jgi:hypothetical protein
LGPGHACRGATKSPVLGLRKVVPRPNLAALSSSAVELSLRRNFAFEGDSCEIAFLQTAGPLGPTSGAYLHGNGN